MFSSTMNNRQQASSEEAFENKLIQFQLCSWFSRYNLLQLGLVSKSWREFTISALRFRKPWIHIEFDKSSNHHIIRKTRLKSWNRSEISLEDFTAILKNASLFPYHQFSINGGDLGSKDVQEFLFTFGHKITAISIHLMILSLETLHLLPFQIPNALKMSITQPSVSPLYSSLALLERTSALVDLFQTLKFPLLKILNFDGAKKFQNFQNLFCLQSLSHIGNYSLSNLKPDTPSKFLKTLQHITIDITIDQQLKSLDFIIKANTVISNVTLLESRQFQTLQLHTRNLHELLQKNTHSITSIHGFFMSFFSSNTILPFVKKATILIGNKEEEYFSSQEFSAVLPNVKSLTLRVYFHCPNYFSNHPQIPLLSVEYLEIRGDFPDSYWTNVCLIFPNIINLDVQLCPGAQLVMYIIFKIFKQLNCVKLSKTISKYRVGKTIEFRKEDNLVTSFYKSCKTQL